MPLPQHTALYKTYVKRSLVEGLREVFKDHPDKILSKTKVSVDFPMTRQEYPSIVVRFFERELTNAGVAHSEWFNLAPDPEEDPPQLQRFKHYLYNGDIEFAIYGLSSIDRDLLADSIVHTLAFGEVETYTDRFFDRIYPDLTAVPQSRLHFMNLNTDKIQGFGETQNMAPWMPEDVLVYQTSYRTQIFGEFYSRVLNLPPSGYVQEVEIYPWIPSVGETEPNPLPDEPNPWIPL